MQRTQHLQAIFHNNKMLTTIFQ